MQAELLALADRVEALEGPDREVDVAILTSLGTHVLERRGRDKKAWFYKVDAPDYERVDPSPMSYGYGALPRYTASLDAAMTTVPPEYRIGVLCELPDGTWACKLFNRDKPGGLPASSGKSAACAVVAASLRARAGRV